MSFNEVYGWINGTAGQECKAENIGRQAQQPVPSQRVSRDPWMDSPIATEIRKAVMDAAHDGREVSRIKISPAYSPRDGRDRPIGGTFCGKALVVDYSLREKFRFTYRSGGDALKAAIESGSVRMPACQDHSMAGKRKGLTVGEAYRLFTMEPKEAAWAIQIDKKTKRIAELEKELEYAKRGNQALRNELNIIRRNVYDAQASIEKALGQS